MCSGEALGIAPLANESKTVVIHLLPLTRHHDVARRLYVPVRSVGCARGKVAAQYAAKDLSAKKSRSFEIRNMLRVCMYFPNRLNRREETLLRTKCITPDRRISYQAIKIKMPVEAIYLILSLAPGLSIVKALKDQNITAKLLTAEVLMGDEIVKENQKILEGVIGFDQAFDDTTEAFKRFTQAYKTANNNEELSYPFYQTALYSEVYLAKELLEKEGNDGEKMQNALSRLSNWNGSVLPNVTLDANGDILWSSFNVKNVRSGKAEKVKVSISSYKRGWCFWQLLEYPDPGSLTP